MHQGNALHLAIKIYEPQSGMRKHIAKKTNGISIFLSEACNVDWSNAVEWYFSERVRFFGIGMTAFFEEEGVRSSVCKYLRQNTVITARLIPLVQTLQMKINPLGLEELVKGIQEKFRKKRTRELTVFFISQII